MSIREDKERLIEEIQKLRKLISEISYVKYGIDSYIDIPANSGKEEAQKKVNDIHNIIFNM